MLRYLKFNLFEDKLNFLAPQTYSSFQSPDLSHSISNHQLGNIGVSSEPSLSFSTWNRHVDDHQHLLSIHSKFEEFLKSSKAEKAECPFPCLPGNQDARQEGSQGCTVSTFMRLKVEVRSLQQAVVEVLESHAQHQWSSVV